MLARKCQEFRFCLVDTRSGSNMLYEMNVPGTTPALRLGPPEIPTPGTLLVVEEPFAVEPRGLVGADGPVRGVDGVALGRDIVVDLSTFSKASPVYILPLTLQSLEAYCMD